MIKDGQGQRETAKVVGYSLLYKLRTNASLITRTPGYGRKRIISQRENRFLVFVSLLNRTTSAVLRDDMLMLANGLLICYSILLFVTDS